ncbi:hypothetical protein BV25DRAFT_1922178 [Artomyces pyxidatus]|uniref:Uncharacterized protein n=1 Tax=Artomyces pyxidatus TaxID=48021 RepID=A0ACB8SH25_9AGAM|nr:hypothetical protein BV25DRAFT_1922178 [Artomyces pyxidatus]
MADSTSQFGRDGLNNLWEEMERRMGSLEDKLSEREKGFADLGKEVRNFEAEVELYKKSHEDIEEFVKSLLDRLDTLQKTVATSSGSKDERLNDLESRLDEALRVAEENWSKHQNKPRDMITLRGFSLRLKALEVSQSTRLDAIQTELGTIKTLYSQLQDRLTSVESKEVLRDERTTHVLEEFKHLQGHAPTGPGRPTLQDEVSALVSSLSMAPLTHSASLQKLIDVEESSNSQQLVDVEESSDFQIPRPGLSLALTSGTVVAAERLWRAAVHGVNILEHIDGSRIALHQVSRRLRGGWDAIRFCVANGFRVRPHDPDSAFDTNSNFTIGAAATFS